MRALPPIPADFAFRKEDHSYWRGARQIPGVSHVLAESQLKPPWFGIRNDAVRHAIQLGTAVHQLTEFMDAGIDHDYEFHEEVEEYRPRWRAFREAFPFEILESEIPRTIKVAGAGDYAGTPDRVVMWGHGRRKRLAILEVKTGASQDWHSLQTAFYVGLLGQPALRIVVYLGPNRKPFGFEKHDHEDSRDWERGRAGLLIPATRKFKTKGEPDAERD